MVGKVKEVGETMREVGTSVKDGLEDAGSMMKSMAVMSPNTM